MRIEAAQRAYTDLDALERDGPSTFSDLILSSASTPPVVVHFENASVTVEVLGPDASEPPAEFQAVVEAVRRLPRRSTQPLVMAIAYGAVFTAPYGLLTIVLHGRLPAWLAHGSAALVGLLCAFVAYKGMRPFTRHFISALHSTEHPSILHNPKLEWVRHVINLFTP